MGTDHVYWDTECIKAMEGTINTEIAYKTPGRKIETGDLDAKYVHAEDDGSGFPPPSR